MRVDGACHCGKLRFEAEVDPEKVGVCHCTDCQTLGGSAFTLFAQVPKDKFWLHGEPRIYVKTAESGNRRAQAFCPDCGTRLYASAEKDPPVFNLRVGTIRGSSMAEAVARAGVPPANVDDGVKPGGLPEALAAGRVKAVLLGIESAITAQRDDPAIELGMFVGAPGSLAFGVRLGDTELRAALDGYIENVRKTATWNRLAVKYFGESAPEVLRKARE